MNIYKIDDADFYADYYKFVEDDLEDLEVNRLTEEQLDTYIFYYDIYNKENEQKQTSFRKRLEELIEAKEEFPLLFASTKY